MRKIHKLVTTDDLVYVEDRAERHEYVLNDTGRLYQSRHIPPDDYQIAPMKWKFGQVMQL